jgi:hypothetical protein
MTIKLNKKNTVYTGIDLIKPRVEIYHYGRIELFSIRHTPDFFTYAIGPKSQLTELAAFDKLLIRVKRLP